jgi:hypothetical protein
MASEAGAPGDGALPDAQDPVAAGEHEVVDERAAAIERLRADARRPAREIPRSKLGDVALQLSDERRLPHVSPLLGQSGMPVLARQRDLAQTLGYRGFWRVAVDVTDEVHAEERERRIGTGQIRALTSPAACADSGLT